MRRHLGLILTVLALTQACAFRSNRTRAGSKEDLAAAMRTVSEFKTDNYKITRGDLIAISVYPDQQLGTKSRVDVDGAISLPLVGTSTVAGMTVLEAQRALEQKLATVLVNPHVTLVVEQYGDRRMFVLGEVANPGSYPIPAGSRMTVLEAISTAGGFTKIAAPRRARVLRYVDGKSVERQIDLKAVARGGQGGDDVIVEPNDIVYVPQSLF